MEIFSPGCYPYLASQCFLSSAALLLHISVSAELGEFHAAVCKVSIDTNVPLGPTKGTPWMRFHTEPRSVFGALGYASSFVPLRSSPNSTLRSGQSVVRLSAQRAFSNSTWRHLFSFSCTRFGRCTAGSSFPHTAHCGSELRTLTSILV